jgi:tetratricopeptide (TPR) repeat protein
MNTIKIFLASSSELKTEREQFEIFIQRKNKLWVDKGVFLDLTIWEDFLDYMREGGLQSAYNEKIKDSDLFVLLAFNKIGKYTDEEFDVAFQQYEKTKRPLIFIYLKGSFTSGNENDLASLKKCKSKLEKKQSCPTIYSSIDDLTLHISNQLEKQLAKELTSFQDLKADSEHILNQYQPYKNMLNDLILLKEQLTLIEPDKFDTRLEISKQINDLTDRQNRIRDDVLRLTEIFSKIDIDTERLKKAKKYFFESEFEKADHILDIDDLENSKKEILTSGEQFTCESHKKEEQAIHLANEFILKAKISALRYEDPINFENTCSFYKNAIQLSDSPENCFEYAKFLDMNKKLLEALLYFDKACSGYETLIETDQDSYEPEAAKLNSILGALYRKLGLNMEADNAYANALKIYESLASKNLEIYGPYLAGTLNNMGFLYTDLKNYSEAENAYLRALEIYERLSAINPRAYELTVGEILNNLGILYSDINNYAKAEEAYSKALKIYEQYASKNAKVYEPVVANTLSNSGNLFCKMGKYTEAESSFIRALTIYDQFAKSNPAVFKPVFARTLSNFAFFYYESKNLTEAANTFLQLLNVYEQLAPMYPGAYEQGIANTLNNLGAIYSQLNDFTKAESMIRRSLELMERLAVTDPETHEPDVAQSINNLGLLFLQSGQITDAITYFNRSLTIYQKYALKSPVVFEPEVCRIMVLLAKSYYKIGDTYRGIEFKEAAREIAIKYQHLPKGPHLFDMLDDLEE